jgi:MoaA/NifB/PqqE/SkfB family radical SAM enzyme
LKLPVNIFSRSLRSKKEETLCLYPFMNIMINADGTYKPCCKYQGNLTHKKKTLSAKDSDLMDVWQSDSMQSLRSDLLKNKRPKGCSVCWKEEAAGIRSMRFDSFNYGITREVLESYPHPLRLDIYPSNICNLQCRICSPHYSTKWIPEARETLGIVEETHLNLTKDNLGWIEKWLPHIKEIGLFGGEPLYLKECVRIMELCVEKDEARHIKLLINTNATIYSEKLVSLFSKFEKVLLNFSIDDIGKRFEYQRKGARWEEAVSNIEAYVAAGGFRHKDRIECKICCTVSAFNVFYLPEFLTWLNQRFPGMKVYLNMLHGPYSLSCNNFPAPVKEIITRRLNNLPGLNISFDNEQTRTMENVVDYLNSSPAAPFKDFVAEVERGDRYRKEDFKTVFKELYDMLQPYL